MSADDKSGGKINYLRCVYGIHEKAIVFKH